MTTETGLGAGEGTGAGTGVTGGETAGIAGKTGMVFDEDPSKDIIWDGITKAKTLAKEGATLRRDLANWARNYEAEDTNRHPHCRAPRASNRRSR